MQPTTSRISPPTPRTWEMLDFCNFGKDGSLESWDIEMHEILAPVSTNAFTKTPSIEIGSTFEFKVVIAPILIEEFLLVCLANVVPKSLDGKHLYNEEGGEELFFEIHAVEI